MPRKALESVLNYLHRVVDRPTAEAPDALLLRVFVKERDEAAFEALVRRHASLVWGTCARVLHDPNDVDDAFQATFFVLARRPDAVSPPEQLGAWLHGVAFRVASKARVARARRTAREHSLSDDPAEATMDEIVRAELASVLDEEIARLPTRYRAPFVLCYLEGRSNEEAARELGRPVGTVFSRLARARELLRRRLVRRGLTFGWALVAAALDPRQVEAGVSHKLLEQTVQQGLGLAAGQTALIASPSAGAVALTEETLRSMFILKFKIMAVCLVALVVAGTSAVLAHHALSATPIPEDAAAAAPNEPVKNEDIEKLKAENAQLRAKLDAIERKLAERDLAPTTYKGKPVRFWLQQLRDVDEETRRAAIKALRAIGQEDQTVLPMIVPALLEVAKKDTVTRGEAVGVLGDFGPASRGTIPTLLTFVGTDRGELGFALKRLDDPEGSHVVPVLIKKLKEKDWEVRRAATSTLGYFRTQGAVTALIKASKDNSPEVRAAAADALAQIGPPLAKAAVPRLLEMLKDKAGDRTAPILGRAVPAESAARALNQIDPEAAKKAGVGEPP